jgi:hypothetical protein
MPRVASRTDWRPYAVLCVSIFALLAGFICWHVLDRMGSKSASISSASRRAMYFEQGPFDGIQTAPSSQSSNFSLLRTPPEGLPVEIRRIMRKPTNGTNWDLAQRLPETGFGEFWLLPGNNFICLIARTGKGTLTSISQTCAPTGVALRHGVASVTLRARSLYVPARNNRFIVGVVPDRAAQIVVHTGSFTAKASVEGNGVFRLYDRAVDPPDSLTLR